MRHRLDRLFSDFRYAFRNLAKDHQFSLVAIFTLALGIGACTLVFSIVYNTFFHALPYKDFGRSVVISMQNSGVVGEGKVRSSLSLPEMRVLREQNHVFEETMTYARFRPQHKDGKSVSFFPWGARVSGNAFEYLGVSPLVGRGITEEDELPGASPVLVMSYRFWQAEFGGDPKILGRRFVLNGKPTMLVGIMPEGFNAFEASFWMPVDQDDSRRSAVLMGRLKRGVSVKTATADLDAIAHRSHQLDVETFSTVGFASRGDFTILAESVLDRLLGRFKETIYILLASVLLVLFIACSNVANLLLARGTYRESKMAMRVALGASRGDLMRQLLAEGVVLSMAAAGAGGFAAYFGLHVVMRLAPAGLIPEEALKRLNGPVFLTALGLAILTTVVCSLAPAMRVLRRNSQPQRTISGKVAGRTVRQGKLRGALVVAEVALSMALLMGAGLLMRRFLALTRVDFGFDPENIPYFVLNLPPSYNTNLPGSRERKNALTRELLERMQALPGVSSVAEFDQPPPLEYETSDITLPGRPHREVWETRYEMCSEGYFQTLGLPLLRGRFFSRDDVDGGRYVMVVNEAFVSRYFPGQDPLGQKVELNQFDLPFLEAQRGAYFEITGIVRDFKTRDYGKASWENFPEVFVPYSVAGFNWRAFMARTSVGGKPVLGNIHPMLKALDPSLRIDRTGTLEGSLQEFYRGPRFELTTFGAFSGMGLLLVIIGIFSVMAYNVAMRTQEIGIRVTLGAQRKNILELVMGECLYLIGGGILIGLGLSYTLTRLLASQISAVSPIDSGAFMQTFAMVAGLVLAAGLIACVVPMRKAMSVDPLVALRYE